MKSLRTSNRVQSWAAALWLAAATASAQSPVAWSLATDAPARPLREGDRFSALVTARIEPGWHLYSLNQPPGGPLATRTSLAAGQPFRVAGTIEAPLPLTGRDAAFNIATEYYEDSVTFTIPVEVAAGISPEQGKLRVEAFFQTCNNQLCLPPTTVILEAAVGALAGQPQAAIPTQDTTGTISTQSAPQRSLNKDSSRRDSAPRPCRLTRWPMGRGIRWRPN